jgi:hypothetical protein
VLNALLSARCCCCGGGYKAGSSLHVLHCCGRKEGRVAGEHLDDADGRLNRFSAAESEARAGIESQILQFTPCAGTLKP